MAPVTLELPDVTGTTLPPGREAAPRRAGSSAEGGKAAARKQVRGSSLLLAGRLVSRLTNFAVQILTVRYLTVGDYGAFAYALSIVQLGQTIATCGLDRAVTRFVPMYQERRDYDRLFGTLLMTAGTILSIGVAIALGVQFFNPWQGGLGEAPQASAVLLILIFLVPLQAADDLVVGLFAVFAEPKAIFVRRHVLAPALKLAVVLLLVFLKSTVLFLAAGYLVASLIGVVWYGVMLVRLMRKNGLLGRLSWGTIQVPWREVLAFTLPLMTSDLLFVAMNSLSVMSLEHFHGLGSVAAFRAQQPIAAMNHMVMVSFATLFTPLAARLFARDDRPAINELYWQTAMWIAILSFPIFVLTFSTAGPLTSLLLGARYESSATLLALLALGYYFDSALGFNGLTLKIYGKLRYVMIISVATIVVTLLANVALIPRYGALGAAMGMCLAMIVHNILKQIGLRLGTGINVFEWRYLRGYCIIVGAASAVFVFHRLLAPSIVPSMTAAAVASWIVFRCNRHLLDLGQTFPELTRHPLLKRVVGL